MEAGVVVMMHVREVSILYDLSHAIVSHNVISLTVPVKI